MLLLVWDKSIGNGYYFQAKVITVSFLLRVMWNDVLYFYLAIQILCWNGLDIIRSVCLRFKKNEMTPEGLQTSDFRLHSEAILWDQILAIQHLFSDNLFLSTRLGLHGCQHIHPFDLTPHDVAPLDMSSCLLLLKPVKKKL